MWVTCENCGTQHNTAGHRPGTQFACMVCAEIVQVPPAASDTSASPNRLPGRSAAPPPPPPPSSGMAPPLPSGRMDGPASSRSVRQPQQKESESSIGGIIAFVVILLVIGFVAFGGCDDGDDDGDIVAQPLINLDTVLDVFVQTYQQLDARTARDDVESGGNSAPVGGPIVPVTEAKPELDEQFLTAFRRNLNSHSSASLGIAPPLGVYRAADGSIRGFRDPNNNTKRDAGEAEIFEIYVDIAQNRVIATDKQNNYTRDHRYHSGSGGFFMAYWLGRMSAAHTRAGVTSSTLASRSVAPRGYHTNVMRQRTAAAAAARSARSSGGSRGFFRGK